MCCCYTRTMTWISAADVHMLSNNHFQLWTIPMSGALACQDQLFSALSLVASLFQRFQRFHLRC